MADASEFLKNEKPNEYQARFTVEGELSVTIIAPSLEAAEAAAKAMMDDEEFGVDLDEITDVRLSYVWKTNPMYLVTRKGVKMQASWLADGDQPRQPDERGF